MLSLTAFSAAHAAVAAAPGGLDLGESLSDGSTANLIDIKLIFLITIISQVAGLPTRSGRAARRPARRAGRPATSAAPIGERCVRERGTEVG